MLTLRSGPVSLPARTKPPSGAVRKIALLGSHSASLTHCPWNDPSWEFWGHAASRAWYKHELDRYFDLHRRECWSKNGKTQTKYEHWLSQNTVPIYMQERHADVPASVRYPKERILMEFGGARRYFKNQFSFMVALAFIEQATHIGLFGINYSHETEYEIQRGSAEYWLGRAEERGIHLIIPEECSLLQEPVGLYGYDSHDENGKRRGEWVKRKPKLAETIVPLQAPPDLSEGLKREIQDEESRRPAYSLLPNERGNGGAHA